MTAISTLTEKAVAVTASSIDPHTAQKPPEHTRGEAGQARFRSVTNSHLGAARAEWAIQELGSLYGLGDSR